MPNEFSNDPRVYLAEQRTFLAWIRTGVSLMGFGFVVARFGLFMREFHLAQHSYEPHSTGLSLYFGTGLLIIGVALNILAAIQHVSAIRKLREGVVFDKPSRLALVSSMLLAALGVGMAVYLFTVN